MKSNALPMQRLDAYVAAKEMARVVHAAGIRDHELRDQATRASKSCFLQLCEGLPSDSAAMRRKYFVCAKGSLHETVGAIDLALAIGAVDAVHADAVHELAFRLKKMLGALAR